MMKTKALSYSIIILFFLSFSSCYSISYFKTPNDVLKIEGALYMNDGTQKKGMITILFENGIDVKFDKIQFLPTHGTIEEDVDVNKIAHYSVNGVNYYPKLINLYHLGVNHFLFVERLTPENSKMDLFKLHQAYKSNPYGQDEDFYFISFSTASKYDAIESTSSKLVPDFNLKMSIMVSDCSELADKIRAGEKEYNYSAVSFGPKRLEVITRIVKEYNECK